MIKRDPEQREGNEDKSGMEPNTQAKVSWGGRFKGEQAGGFWPSSLLFPSPS